LTVVIRAAGPLASAIPSTEIRQYLGQNVVVCGNVVLVHPTSGPADPLVFDLGADGQPADLSGVIAGRNRSSFSTVLDHYLANRQVCIHGKVRPPETGLPEIDVDRSAFVFFGAPPGPPPDFGGGAVDLLVDDDVAKDDVAKPVLLKRVDPKYTPAAMATGVAGSVQMEAVVAPDGHVARVSIVRSLDPFLGLDDEAVAAALKWRFQPAVKAGQPVSAVVSLELRFAFSGPRPAKYPVPLQTWEPKVVPGPVGATEEAESFGSGAAKAGDSGLTGPKIRRSRPPRYPLDALRQWAQREVIVDVIVGPDGQVQRARVARPSAAGLASAEEEALRCVRAWTFVPGRRDGQPVATWVQAAIGFHLWP
jgi:TonB family protein